MRLKSELLHIVRQRVMKELIINGSPRQFAAQTFPATLTELLVQMNVDSATVVAEIGGQIIPRMDFDNTILEAGQKIELIRFVGGG